MGHASKEPSLFYYRDKDKREIDLVIERDGRLHPIEIKKAATLHAHNAPAVDFRLSRGAPLGQGAVLSFCETALPLDRRTLNFPIGWI